MMILFLLALIMMVMMKGQPGSPRLASILTSHLPGHAHQHRRLHHHHAHQQHRLHHHHQQHCLHHHHHHAHQQQRLHHHHHQRHHHHLRYVMILSIDCSAGEVINWFWSHQLHRFITCPNWSDPHPLKWQRWYPRAKDTTRTWVVIQLLETQTNKQFTTWSLSKATGH